VPAGVGVLSTPHYPAPIHPAIAPLFTKNPTPTHHQRKGLGNLERIGLDARITNNPNLTTLLDLPRSLRSIGAALVGDLVITDNPSLTNLGGLGAPGGALSEVVGEVVVARNGAGLAGGDMAALQGLGRAREVTVELVRRLLAAPASGTAAAAAGAAAAAPAPPAAGSGRAALTGSTANTNTLPPAALDANSTAAADNGTTAAPAAALTTTAELPGAAATPAAATTITAPPAPAAAAPVLTNALQPAAADGVPPSASAAPGTALPAVTG